MCIRRNVCYLSRQLENSLSVKRQPALLAIATFFGRDVLGNQNLKKKKKNLTSDTC